MGGVGSYDPVPNFHEEFVGASSKFLAFLVLEIFASESDGGRTLVAYSRVNKKRCRNLRKEEREARVKPPTLHKERSLTKIRSLPKTIYTCKPIIGRVPTSKY